jgi:sugar phosphate isomerase/epimerase
MSEHNTLTEEERSAGWELLFEGVSTGHWRGFRHEDFPAGWVVVEGIKSLQDLGSRAADAGVILSLEAHEPFGHNGDVVRRTVEAVNPPGVRWNYDSAHIYYDNESGIHTVAELRKALPCITSVHLKESAKGEPRSFDFPVLGEGMRRLPRLHRCNLTR